MNNLIFIIPDKIGCLQGIDFLMLSAGGPKCQEMI